MAGLKAVLKASQAGQSKGQPNGRPIGQPVGKVGASPPPSKIGRPCWVIIVLISYNMILDVKFTLSLRCQRTN